LRSICYFSRVLLSGCLAVASLFGQTSTSAPTVRFKTNLGDIDVLLTPDVAPATVANFLNYVNRGAYNNSIFHRSVPGFIIQGGGYNLVNHAPAATPQSAAVKNEPNVTNARGTIAMAKLGTDPNSATNQWFFNLANNGSNLDHQNGGFTVFGQITSNSGLAVMDTIARQPTYNAGSPFDQLPLQNYKGGTIQDANFLLVTSIVRLPWVTPAGFTNASTFALSNTNGIAPGEILTIFGTAIGPAALQKLALDSSGAVTTSLSGTRVLFDGVAAPLLYTVAGQTSVVAPQSLAGKDTVQVVVEYQGVQTAGVGFSVVKANPGIFTLNSKGSGDGAIIRPDGTVINQSNPAVPGEILSLYGEGYGASTPSLADGVLVGTDLPVPVNPVTLLIDGNPVPTLYAGGAPSLINGMLQVNFTVPDIASGSHSIQIQVADRTSPAGVNLQTK
jgi:uncharacterized protein (TIGR03437 family)